MYTEQLPSLIPPFITPILRSIPLSIERDETPEPVPATSFVLF
jgi:hypothetical protein